jgi:glycosyltransferase involved in cell wall biosynthesis
VLVTGAEALVDGYSSYYKIPKKSIQVISNWIDLTRIQYDPLAREKIRCDLNISETSPVLLFVQKLSKRKGAHLLPEIFDTLHDSKTHLIIAGDGPEEKGLHEWVSEHSAQVRIHFTGRVSREKMTELYQSADIFLLPSEEEGSSHSLIEAMAHQLPLVGFAVGGVPETVPPALRGYLCPFGDVTGMVSGIKRLLTQPAEIIKVKQQEEQWVQRYDKQRITNQFVTLLWE